MNDQSEQERSSNLWRHTNFLRFWSANIISDFGSGITFLPGLISRDNLVEGYSKLSASNSAIELSGPALAATLIELLTAPIALVIDAASFLLSSVLLGTMKLDEPAPQPVAERPSTWQQIRQGLSFIRHHTQLKPMLLNNSSMQLFGGIIDALLIIYLLQLGLPATFVGVIFAVGSVAGLAAAAWGRRAARRFGLGRMVVLGSLLIGVGALARPLAFGTPWLAGAILLLGQTVSGFGNTVYDIGYYSLAQSLTPDELLGRVNATGLFVSFGALPLGALLGGVLGELFGLRTAVAISSIGLLLSVLWVYFSPLRYPKISLSESV
ncbi:MAG: MFS transporter [Anaerolineaceae bacterium]|nr:MFS transporter [Anaerolineaceae bacterium]